MVSMYFSDGCNPSHTRKELQDLVVSGRTWNIHPPNQEHQEHHYLSLTPKNHDINIFYKSCAATRETLLSRLFRSTKGNEAFDKEIKFRRGHGWQPRTQWCCKKRYVDHSKAIQLICIVYILGWFEMLQNCYNLLEWWFLPYTKKSMHQLHDLQ